ncbi:Hypothetical protein KLENKIAIHU_723 [Klenkia terrae]|nr:Hypothetical protein KLENKIAIHU_723 [Klenkia terrae]
MPHSTPSCGPLGTSPGQLRGKLPPGSSGEAGSFSSNSPVQPSKVAMAAWSLRERRTAASTRGLSTPRTWLMAAITSGEGSAPGRPSSSRKYVMTDNPGPVTSFVANPAAKRRAARGGSSRSTSRRYKGSTPSAVASLGTKRGRGRSSPVSQTRMRTGLESSRFSASSSRLRPMASRAACRRSPRSSGRATAAPPSPDRWTPAPWRRTLVPCARPDRASASSPARRACVSARCDTSRRRGQREGDVGRWLEACAGILPTSNAPLVHWRPSAGPRPTAHLPPQGNWRRTGGRHARQSRHPRHGCGERLRRLAEPPNRGLKTEGIPEQSAEAFAP